MLNKDQIRIVGICVIVAILMGFFPPWIYTFKIKSSYSEEPAGYGLIFSPPAVKGQTKQYGKMPSNRFIFEGENNSTIMLPEDFVWLIKPASFDGKRGYSYYGREKTIRYADTKEVIGMAKSKWETTSRSYRDGIRLDYGRLFIQWFIVFIAGVFFTMMTKTSKPKPTASSETTTEGPEPRKEKLDQLTKEFLDEYEKDLRKYKSSKKIH